MDAGAHVDEEIIRKISLGFPQTTEPDGSSVPKGPTHLIDYIEELREDVSSGKLPKPRRSESEKKSKKRKSKKKRNGKKEL